MKFCKCSAGKYSLPSITFEVRISTSVNLSLLTPPFKIFQNCAELRQTSKEVCRYISSFDSYKINDIMAMNWALSMTILKPSMPENSSVVSNASLINWMKWLPDVYCSTCPLVYHLLIENWISQSVSLTLSRKGFYLTGLHLWILVACIFHLDLYNIRYSQKQKQLLIPT